MIRLIRIVAVASTGALLVALVPGVAAAKTASNQQYAKAYCDAVENALGALDTLEPDLYSAPTADALRTTALAGIDGLLAGMESDATDLEQLTPKDGGKKVGALMHASLTQQVTSIQAAREAFAAADPSARAFTQAADALLIGTLGALNSWDAPFTQLGKQPALRKALTKECNISRSAGT